MNDLKQLLRFTLKHNRKHLPLAIALICLIQALTTIHPLILSKIIDHYSQSRISLVIENLWIYLALTLFLAAIIPGKTLLKYIAENTKRHLSVLWNKKCLSKDHQEFAKTPAVKIVEQFDRASEYTGHVIETVVERHAPDLIKLLIISIYMILLDLSFMLVVLLPSGIIILVFTRYYSKILRPMMDQTNDFNDQTIHYFGDIFENGPAIKLSRAKNTALKDFHLMIQKYFEQQTKENFYTFAFMKTSQLFIWLTQAFLLACCIYLLDVHQSTTLSAGNVVAGFVYASFFLNTTLRFSEMIYDMEAWSADKAHMDKILSLPQRPETTNTPQKILSDLTIKPFVLSSTHIPLIPLRLSHEITVPHGSKVLITGASGEGKSLLASVIAGLFRIENTVFWGSEDISHFSFHELSKRVYFAKAKTDFLYGNFSQSVLFTPTIDQPKAAKDLLESLHMEKFLTYLDNHEIFPTHNLSSGEKKRLGLFRAMTLNKPLTMIDDPTEGINPEITHSIWKLLKEYFVDHSLICLSHNSTSNYDYDMHLHIQNHEITIKKS